MVVNWLPLFLVYRMCMYIYIYIHTFMYTYMYMYICVHCPKLKLIFCLIRDEYKSELQLSPESSRNRNQKNVQKALRLTRSLALAIRAKISPVTRESTRFHSKRTILETHHAGDERSREHLVNWQGQYPKSYINLYFE